MALEGTLHDMSLADLFQVFHMGAKSGVLVLVSGIEQGLLYVREGHLIDAILVRGAERQVLASGEDAVLQLLQWENADFTFRHTVAVAERPTRIVHDSEWLVLEGMRRRTTPQQVLPHEEISPETRFDLVPTPRSARADVGLELDQWRILSQIAGRPNLTDICTTTGIPHDRALRALRELLAIGLIEIALPTNAPTLPRRTRTDAARRPTSHPLMADFRAPTANVAMTTPTTSERGLIRAIMRRVRGL